MDMTRRDFAALASAALVTPAAQAAGAPSGQAPAVQSGQIGSGSNEPRLDRPRVVAVSAHPADFCSRAGGTLIKYVQAGCPVKVVWFSHGETDESQLLYRQRPGISIEEVRQIREREAFACLKVIGAEGRMLGFGDNPIRITPERMDIVAKEIADFNPTILVTHWRNEVTYPSHWITGNTVLAAAQQGHATWNIHFFEPTIGTAGRVGFEPDHYVDITDVFEQKMAALRELPTQPTLVELYTTCNRWHGIESGCQYAEAFVRWQPKATLGALLD